MDTCKIDNTIILFWFIKAWVYQNILYAQRTHGIQNNQEQSCSYHNYYAIKKIDAKIRRLPIKQSLEKLIK